MNGKLPHLPGLPPLLAIGIAAGVAFCRGLEIALALLGLG